MPRSPRPVGRRPRRPRRRPDPPECHSARAGERTAAAGSRHAPKSAPIALRREAAAKTAWRRSVPARARPGRARRRIGEESRSWQALHRQTALALLVFAVLVVGAPKRGPAKRTTLWSTSAFPSSAASRRACGPPTTPRPSTRSAGRAGAAARPSPRPAMPIAVPPDKGSGRCSTSPPHCRYLQTQVNGWSVCPGGHWLTHCPLHEIWPGGQTGKQMP